MRDTAAPILIVDDYVENLVALEAVLAPLGQPVVRAVSGQEALGHLLEREFALILMDVQMPGLTGIETAALIRQRPRCQHIPIVFITALSRETQHVMNAYQTGAVDYLLKPLDPDLLRAKVSSFIELYVRGQLLRERDVQLAERRRAEEDAKKIAEFAEQLIGIVGHDLRGPLTAVRASSELGLRDPALPEKHRRHFERIHRSSRRMQYIVETLLDLTRTRAGSGIPIHKQERDLVEIAQAVVDEFSAANPDARVQIHAGAQSLRGCFDTGKVGQAIWNLLDNAAHHGVKDAPIRVGLGGDHDAVFFEVRNLGKAIAPELRATLFEPFRRLPDTSAQKPRDGLGLGLHIVSQIVKAHGGSIEVSSDDETGTAFTVRLPRALAKGECADVAVAAG